MRTASSPRKRSKEPVLDLLLELVRDQYRMIQELNDRLMAQNLTDYKLFRQACDTYPDVRTALEKLVEETRRRAAQHDGHQAAITKSMMPSIDEMASAGGVDLHQP